MTRRTSPTDAAPGVDPDELARHIAEMYRDVANEAVRDLHFHTGRGPRRGARLPRRPARPAAGPRGAARSRGWATTSASRTWSPGERVLDLGSGSGMDVFAAALAVGPRGSVTGVDITPEQLAKAERLRRDAHVSFRRARIEELPFDDASFDAVISNGVVNLSADKPAVFAEAARVLRPGGRLALADIVTRARDRRAHRGPARPLGRLHRGASQRDRYLERHRGGRPGAAHGPDNPAYRLRQRAGAGAPATSTAPTRSSSLAVKPSRGGLEMSGHSRLRGRSPIGRLGRWTADALPRRRGGVGRGRGGPRGPRAARREGAVGSRLGGDRLRVRSGAPADRQGLQRARELRPDGRRPRAGQDGLRSRVRSGCCEGWKPG